MKGRVLAAFVVILFITSLYSSVAWSPLRGALSGTPPRFVRRIAAVLFTVGACELGAYSPAFAEREPMSMTFSDFIPEIRSGNVERVVFKGIRPTFLTAYTKDNKMIKVEEGFPAFDDPMSPSGPTQAIALCQHSPGVVVEQDISDLIVKSKTKGGKYSGPKPMLKSSAYPSTYDNNKK